jgi:hypothetical protein
MRILFVFLGLVIFTLVSTSAQTSIFEVVNKVNDDPGLRSYDRILDGMNKLDYRIPFLEEINFRTESDQNNLSRQEYTLRTVFNGLGLTKVYNREKSIYLQQKILERNTKWQSLLYKTYNSIIDVYYLTKKDSLATIRYALNRKRLDHFIEIVSSGTPINAKEILRLEEDNYRSLSNRNEDSILINEHLAFLKTSDIDVRNWRPISEIKTIVEKLDMTTLGQSQLDKLKFDFEKSRIKYQLSRKEDQRIIDYAQLRYSKRDNLLFQDEFSIGLGVRLPYKGSAMKSRNEFITNQYEYELKSVVAASEVVQEVSKLKLDFNKIVNEIAYYQSSQSRIFTILNEKHIENSVEIEYFKTDFSLTTNEKINELAHKAWNIYLEILHRSGKLLQNGILTR